MRIIKLQRYCQFFVLIGLASLLGGCSNSTLVETALQHKLNYQRIETTVFQLAVVTRVINKTKRTQPARVYLEGDGIPWVNNQPNTDPTGRDRLAFKLFMVDEAATAYVARPCYEQETMPQNCNQALWTSGRYGETVVTALMEAIEQVVPTGQIELVGYSGGGALAALLAHRMPRVSRLLTIAANLDHDAWSEHHGSIPLTSSLNPVDDAPAASLGELHLFGSEDTIAPAALATNYFEKHEAAIGLVEGFTHYCCWIEQWPQILDEWKTQESAAP